MIRRCLAVAALLLCWLAASAGIEPPTTDAAPKIRRTPTPVATAVPTSTVPRLLFSDEFDGSALDGSKWVTCFWSGTTDGCSSAPELEWYSPANVTVSDGLLHLTARAEASHGYAYTSGMVTTGRLGTSTGPAKFEMTYGYAEARLKVPAGRGLWPAWWQVVQWPGPSPLPEIDVLELLGQDPTIAYMTYHGSAGQSSTAYFGPDFSADFHTFGADWQPGLIVWSIDGVEQKRYADPSVGTLPMYLLLNLAVGGGWPGPPDAMTPFPSELQVDWVRVYDRRP